MNTFYYAPCSHMVSKGQRFGLISRFRLWKRRRRVADLDAARRWNG